MIAEAVRRSPLAGYAERFAAIYEATSGALSIRELPFLTQINLRVDVAERAVMTRLGDALGFHLPLTPNTVASAGDRRALWLAPAEWVIIGGADRGETIEQPLRDALAGASASIVDVSANRTVLLIQGERALALLAQGIAIDLHPRVFLPGRCAQTLLTKVQVILERSGSDEAFRLYVRSSYAGYLADWLLDAAGAPE